MSKEQAPLSCSSVLSPRMRMPVAASPRAASGAAAGPMATSVAGPIADPITDPAADAVADPPAADVVERIRVLDPWFHNLRLAGVETAPDHFLGDYPALKWQAFADALPQDLSGRTVLDVGCNAGFYAIEMKKRGADRVVAIDTDDRYLAQARLAAELSGVELELHQLSVYDVATLHEQFDVTLFMGVLYHLRHPLLALDLLHDHVVRDLFVFQSMLRGATDDVEVDSDYPITELSHFERPGYPSVYFVERRYAADPTNWWIPNRACAAAMLRSAGFAILSQPEAEVFVCRASTRPALEDL